MMPVPPPPANIVLAAPLSSPKPLPPLLPQLASIPPPPAVIVTDDAVTTSVKDAVDGLPAVVIAMMGLAGLVLLLAVLIFRFKRGSFGLRKSQQAVRRDDVYKSAVATSSSGVSFWLSGGESSSA